MFCLVVGKEKRCVNNAFVVHYGSNLSKISDYIRLVHMSKNTQYEDCVRPRVLPIDFKVFRRKRSRCVVTIIDGIEMMKPERRQEGREIRLQPIDLGRQHIYTQVSPPIPLSSQGVSDPSKAASYIDNRTSSIFNYPISKSEKASAVFGKAFPALVHEEQLLGWQRDSLTVNIHYRIVHRICSILVLLVARRSLRCPNIDPPPQERSGKE